MAETIFTKIINREIPADIVHEDEFCLAFRDINPQAPVHILIIPKKIMRNLAESESGDKELLGHILLVAHEIAAKEGVADGFRLVLNNGEAAGQEVMHMHFHLLAGRAFSWPPG